MYGKYEIRAEFNGPYIKSKFTKLTTILNFQLLTVFFPLIHSAVACLPESLVEKLIPNIEIREKLKEMHKAVQAISSDKALSIYHESIQKSDLLRSMDCQDHSEEIFRFTVDSSSNKLESHYKELLQILSDCPKIEVSEKLETGDD